MSRIKFEEFDNKGKETISFLHEGLRKLRSGRAHPSLVEDINVEAYGSQQPIKNLANIIVVDAGLLSVQPWDKSLVGAIVKAIQEANIGINPVSTGDQIRLPLPSLTEERRMEYVKLMKEEVEETRKTVRVLRKDVLIGLAKEKEDGELSEDELSSLEKDLQKKVDKVNEEIDSIAKKKEEELMKV